jgi:RNA recognition motif-containing protein
MNIYVAKFGIELQESELKDLFAAYGNVQSATIEIDAFTDKSRGFGSVEMPNDEEAKAAIAALNQSEVKGHKIVVQEAEVKEVRRGSYKVGSGGVNPYRFKKS